MSESIANETPVADSLFFKELVKQWRAQDMHGAWEGKSDLKLLEPYVVTKEQRRQMPIMGDPDPETLWRLELFYNAVGLAIERATGIMVSPMMKMSHEGFGRMILTAGRLVVINKHLRDVHRFGFETYEKLVVDGEKLTASGIEMIEKFPDVARILRNPVMDDLKTEIKKLSARAMQAKMDLHDLSEELPINWDRIPEVASRAHALFKELEAKRAALKG